ncbi:MAG TPA: hypothetical protein VFE38_17160 [Edaphobacter sp.]|nr:hypothetical protein [Edaphobacter sp.]
MLRQLFAAATLVALSAPHLCATSFEAPHGAVRVEVRGSGSSAEEIFLAKAGNSWIPALSATSSTIHVKTATGTQVCVLLAASPIERGLLLTGDCGIGQFEQRVVQSAESDILNVSTRLTIKANADVRSVEDRYTLSPRVMRQTAQ